VTFSRAMILPLVLLLLNCSPSVAQTQQKAATVEQKADVTGKQPLKPISMPTAPYPEEALRKGIEGKVKLRIVIDAKGEVSQAKVLSGPPELVPAAIASAKMWKFEPPVHAPVTKTTSIWYGHPKECPGPISDSVELMGSGRLSSKNGKLAAVPEGDPWQRYLEADSKARVAGKMVLSVNLDPDGRVKEIHVIRSVSPTLDKMVVHITRPLKFRRIGNPTASLEDLRMQLVFLTTCNTAPE
jgi:TonB family protein